MLGSKSRKTVELEAFQRPCGWSIPAALIKIDWVAGVLIQISPHLRRHLQRWPYTTRSLKPCGTAEPAKSSRRVWRKLANLFIENAIVSGQALPASTDQG
jgi:hypothetical protein